MDSKKPLVPIIDFSQPDDQVAIELFCALSTIGFVCLKNTGICEQVERWTKHCKDFFSLPEETKMKFVQPNHEFGGWVGRNKERLNHSRPADLKECFNAVRSIIHDPERYPVEMHATECLELYDTFMAVAHRAIRLIAKGLNLEDDHGFIEHHNQTNSWRPDNVTTLRLNFYPKIADGEAKPDQVRFGEHSDFGSIALVWSDSPGLEVFNRETGEYQSAGDPDGTIFLNVGDLLQMWSADVLKSTKHRVMMPDGDTNKERLSVAFFVHPHDNVLIESLDGSNKYPATTSVEWLNKMFASMYTVVSEEQE